METNMCQVTIGIPTYNTPLRYFDILINQVLNQTYNDIDVLIVDDGSKPEFTNRLAKLSQSDSRIRLLLKQDNTGVYDTRNVILKNIKGSFFTFIDSDDYIPLNYIERLMSSYNDFRNGVETIVCCNFICFTKDIPILKKQSGADILFDDAIIENALMGKFGHNMWGKLIPTSLIENVTIDPERGFDDAQLIPVISAKAKRIVVNASTTYGYRQNGGSIMHSNNHSLYQSFKTYSFYLEIAKQTCPNCLNYLRTLVLLSEFKLCCVDYDEIYSKNNLYNKSRELRKHILKNGFCSCNYKKQLVLASFLPSFFYFLYRKKRKADTSVHNR